VLTFTPHPSRLFRPENPTLLIQPPDHKAAVLEGMGLDVLIRMPFTRELAAVAARDFVPFLKQRLPSLRTLHIGENFRFGKAAMATSNLDEHGAPTGLYTGEVATPDARCEPSATAHREVLKLGRLPAVTSCDGQ
jgi:riboflavin kinase/FMN adenylyltransferase